MRAGTAALPRAPLLLATAFALLGAAPCRHRAMASAAAATSATARNVLGGPLGLCSSAPLTGFYRDGFCHTGPADTGRHVVAARVTAEFLAFTRSRGNDLSTPHPPHFPGLKPGDGWCLCALRWREAYDAGVAPPVLLAATHEAALRYVTLDQLREHAIDGEGAPSRETAVVGPGGEPAPPAGAVG